MFVRLRPSGESGRTVLGKDAPLQTSACEPIADVVPLVFSDALAGPKEHRSGDVVVGPRPQFLQEGAEGQRPCVYRKPGEPISYHIQGRNSRHRKHLPLILTITKSPKFSRTRKESETKEENPTTHVRGILCEEYIPRE